MKAKIDCEPFGDEWKKEMKKWRKEDLIEYLKKELIKASNKESLCSCEPARYSYEINQNKCATCFKPLKITS